MVSAVEALSRRWEERGRSACRAMYRVLIAEYRRECYSERDPTRKKAAAALLYRARSRSRLTTPATAR